MRNTGNQKPKEVGNLQQLEKRQTKGLHTQDLPWHLALSLPVRLSNSNKMRGEDYTTKIAHAPNIGIRMRKLTEPGSMKEAVEEAEGAAEGTSLLPKAIPTMAVMWVSGPNTESGMPRF